MLNYEVFNKEIQPTETEIKDFIGADISPLYVELDSYLRERYKIKPKFSHSSCSMDQNIWRGWNIKYQKSGKSLCTIYPQEGYFMVLVPGRPFEVRSEGDLIELKLAIEIRGNEIGLKV